MRLDELPVDIVARLPDYLCSLDDLFSLIRTCRAFYNCYANSKAKLRPDFAKRYGQRLFPPHPHLLIAGCARSVADWALASTENELSLQTAFEGGIDGLFDFCTREGRMSLQDAKALTAAKYELLNPMSREVDKIIGPAERARDYAEDNKTLDDDDGEWWTIVEYPELCLLNHWIYCELFHHNVESALSNPAAAPKTLSLKTRATFLSYCIPDCNDKITEVPKSIAQQLYGYSYSPWETAKNSHRISCFMLIQELLYHEDWTPFSVDAIEDVLLDRTHVRMGMTRNQGNPRPPVSTRSPAQHLLYNTILHRPLLCFRLLLPGGLEATRQEIEELKGACEQPDAGYLWFETLIWAREYISPVPPESETLGVDKAGESIWWRWQSMENDCAQIIWR